MPLHRRMLMHKAASKKGDTAVCKAWREQGAPIVDTLHVIPFKDLNSAEIYHIEAHNTLHPNGYNSTKGGKGTGWSEQAKERVKKTRRTPEMREASRLRMVDLRAKGLIGLIGLESIEKMKKGRKESEHRRKEKMAKIIASEGYREKKSEAAKKAWERRKGLKNKY